MSRRILFIHPDLGIGGAERAMVDAALALKSKGHECEFYTAHHDPNHCFTETKDGTFDVTVAGDWMPRSILGYCHVICAYLRMIYVTLAWLFMGPHSVDVIICDQISACIPLLKWFSEAKILFYCHFPDKLLAKRDTGLRRLYRAPIDYLEEKTTGMADQILVNSQFTASIFKQHFTSLKHYDPDIVYPVPDFKPFDKEAKPLPDSLHFDGPLFLSLNRYERKKNIGLALGALEQVLEMMEKEGKTSDLPHLIVAGGYDERVKENVDHYDELTDYTRRLQIDARVTFLRSVTDELKHSLLKSCQCLIYTPENEHFGIVPVEAMYCKLPVIAVNSGGPLETVNDGKTGFLCSSDPAKFAEKMKLLAEDSNLRKEFGENGHTRMLKHFSFETYTEKLTTIIDGLIEEDTACG